MAAAEDVPAFHPEDTLYKINLKKKKRNKLKIFRVLVVSCPVQQPMSQPSGVQRTFHQLPTDKPWEPPWGSVPSLAGVVSILALLFFLATTYVGLYTTALVLYARLNSSAQRPVNAQRRMARLRDGMFFSLFFPVGIVVLPLCIHYEKKESR